MQKPHLPTDVLCALRCLFCAALILLTVLPALPANREDAVPVYAEALPCGLADDLQLELLARVIAAEVGHTTYIEQIAYGAMLRNREADPRFPQGLGQVIGAAELHIADGEIAARSLRAARSAVFGIDPTDGALYCFSVTDTAARALFADRITAEFEHLFFAR